MRSRLCLDLGILSARMSAVHLGCLMSDGTLSFGYTNTLSLTVKLNKFVITSYIIFPLILVVVLNTFT